MGFSLDLLVRVIASPRRAEPLGMTLARYLAVCYSVTVLCMVLPDAVADWWWEWRGSA